MPEFVIHSWNPVIPDKGTFPFPMLYIEATNDLLKYASKNNFTILVTIKGSSSVYDDKPMIAVLDTSAKFPNNRTNFFNKHNFYTLTLVAAWFEYPKLNGVAVIEYIDENKIPCPKFETPKPIEWTEWYNRDSTPLSGMSNPDLTKIYIFIIIVMLFMVGFGLRKY